jgi:EAL domain-containing protein (putative c-di-GMP-specific phosphodiesterase class I)
MLCWQHPTHGLLAPEVLRPIAERTGLVDGLTRYVLEGALRQRGEWQRAGYDWPVAVNVSMRSLDRQGFAPDVEALLEKWDVPPRHLKLEVLESGAVADPTRAAGALDLLRKRGARVALDHFGTAHSSLAPLRVLPLDEIKLDGSLVGTVTDDPGDAAIVRSTVDLARSLGLRVAADGVDTPGTCSALAELGCLYGQGANWSAPLPADRLTAWLAKQLADTAEERAA